jgi:uncharacterized protein YigE (DUF2233 family)
MRYLKLFEGFQSDDKFYYYRVEEGQDVIIRNDTIGKEGLTIPLGPIKYLLQDMGGPNSIKTDFPVKGKTKPFAIDFAMNACLFEPNGKNTGYFRFYNKEITPLNNMTDGNFGMHLDKNSGERNGVFYGSGSKWNIVGTSKFNNTDAPFAIQNGPILVLDGKINSVFNQGSPNKDYRGGIGVDKDGHPCFVISKQADCNFYELADYFLKTMGCDNAIYTDGAVVQTYSREGGKDTYMGNTAKDLGPLILVTKK